MTDQRIYHAPNLDFQKLGETLSKWLQGQGLDTQVLAAPGEAVVVQARDEHALHHVAGTSVALKVMMARQGENLLVQIGSAEWAGKTAVAAVGWFLFWPAAITAAYGFWKQKQLPQRILQFIDQYVVSGGNVPIVPTALVAPVAQHTKASKVETRCPSCNQLLSEGANYCGHCGASMTPACTKCGAALPLGAKYCSNCGAPVEPRHPSGT
jgi:RNA polymerase subunit RPABC4/transcription elongation factor Spt4